MPTRLIREAINSSPRVNALTPGAELFYRRLLSVADDYGRFHASPATLRGACWPTCPEKITEAQVTEWLRECSAGERPLVDVYLVGGARYLEISDFGQQKRSKSKFPGPLGETARDAITVIRKPKEAEAPPDNNCLAIDNGLQTDAEQLLSTSRSRITKSKTESGAGPASENKVPTFPEKGEEAIRETIERMYALHPKKRNLALVPVALKKAVSMEADPSGKLAEIEKCHAAWCKVEDWTKKDGSFAPKLDEWIADQGYTKWPQGYGRDSPKPQQTGLREDEREYTRRIQEQWRKEHPEYGEPEERPLTD